MLNQVFDDPACAIIFELEYVVSIPVQVNVISNKNNKKNALTDTKKQNEIHHILTQWTVYCPFAGKTFKYTKIDVNMLGGSSKIKHPEGKLVYKSSDETQPGKINFSIKRGDQVN